MRPSLLAFLPFALTVLLPSSTNLASAHGMLESIVIAGKPYAGPPPAESGNTASSVIRQIRSNGPVDGSRGAVNNKFMSCGNDAKPAALEADAMPGDVVELQWSPSWPHLVGPMLTYLASCNGPCTSFDSANARWFKIDQKAFKASSGAKEWVQADLSKGLPDTVTLPASLKAGSYLMRHEVIASHNIPVEYYPACAQIKVGGSGQGVPKEDELVSFPGAYSGSEGALNTNGYQVLKRQEGFEFPGPKISILASGGEGGETQNVPQEEPKPDYEGGSCGTNYKRDVGRRRAIMAKHAQKSH